MENIKTYRINSISDYLNIIKNNNLQEYIFRGQNEPFYGIKASLFRKYEGSFDSDKIYNLKELIDKYYNKVIHRLTMDERKNFLAFCQHHGLPTNLVDFSYSPLIALFFACYGKQATPNFTLNQLIGETITEKLISDTSTQNMLIHNLCNRLNKDDISKYAQIYLISKKRLIDITEITLENKYENIFEEIINNDDIQLKIYSRIEEVFPKDNESILEWINNMLSCYDISNWDIKGNPPIFNKGNEKNDIHEFREKLNANIENIKELYLYIKENAFDNKVKENIFYSIDDFDFSFSNVDYSLIGCKIYFQLLINILKIFSFYKADDLLTLNLDIYFIVKCPNIFDRISNQKGLFIYQPFLYYEEPVYDYHILNLQRITPDVVIEVDNYYDILKDLGYLGIGLDFIYNDFDSIAKFIKDNN